MNNIKIMAAAAATALFAGQATAETFELTLSTYMPPAYAYVWEPLETFVEMIEAESEGRIKVNVFHSAQLFDGYQELGAVSRGDVDIVNMTGTYPSGTVPALSIFTLPFMFTDIRHLERALEAGLLDLGIAEELETTHNTVVLGVGPFDPYQLYSKSDPIETMEDIGNKVWATTGSIDARAIQLMGGAPTGMSSSDLYLSFDRGVIDGTPRPLLTGVGRSLDEVVGHLSMVTFGVDTSILAINGDTWASLPEDLQDIVSRAAAARDAQQFAMVEEFMTDALANFEEKGMSIHYVPEDELAKMKAATAPAVSEWLAKVPEGQSYIDVVEAASN